jgi:phosphohistidine phosphatase
MDLYVIRHAEAAPLGAGGVTEDAARPLTPAGEAQARAVAAALHRKGIRLAALVTSPLLRARQTAEHLQKVWSAGVPAQECPHLAFGGKRRKLTQFLNKLGHESIAVIGHEPDLSMYIGWLIGSRKARIELAKASVALLKSEGELGKGRCTLAWLFPPEWLAE